MKSGSMADFFYHATQPDQPVPAHRSVRLLIGGLVALLVLSAVAVVGGIVLGSGAGAGAGVALVGGICFVLCLAFLLLLDFRAAYREGADDWDRVAGGMSAGEVPQRATGEAWVDRAERTPDTDRLVLIALDAMDAPYPVAGEAPASYPDERRIGLGRMVHGGTSGPEFDVEAQGKGRVTQWAEIPRLRASTAQVSAVTGSAGKRDGDCACLLPTTGDDHD